MRYPRGTGPGVPVQAEMTALPVGKAQLRREGKQRPGAPRLRRAGGAARSRSPSALDATVVNMRFVKPLDEELLVTLARAPSRLRHHRGERQPWAAPAARCGELLAAEGLQLPVLQLGMPDRFIEHGSREGCLAAAGLDAAGLGRECRALVGAAVARAHAFRRRCLSGTPRGLTERRLRIPGDAGRVPVPPQCELRV